MINVTNTFFSAAQSTMTRRAASIGPGSGDHGEESRGRSSRRSASVMPGRQLSHGRSYARDSLFPEDALSAEPAPPLAGNSARTSTLSRISSEENLASGDIPPVLPGERAPSYEVAMAADSRPPSPVRQHSGASLTVNTNGSELAAPVNYALRRHLDRSPTPSRSPLGNAATVLTDSRTSSLNGSAVDIHRLHRTTTGASHLSQESTSSNGSLDHPSHPPFQRQISSSSNPSLSSDPDQIGDGWNSAPVPGSSTSSFERGRPSGRDPSRTSAGTDSAGREGRDGDAAGSLDDVRNGVASMTFQPRSSLRQSPSPSPSPAPTLTGDRRRRLSSSSSINGRRSASASSPSPLPSALKTASSTGRSASRGARFSLHGISEVLRGKSTSRARTPSSATNGDLAPPMPELPHRSSSPDASASRPRSQSRGRKTALKALREALTSGHSHNGLHGDGAEGSGGNGQSEHAIGDGWKEFKAGTYTYPISISIPASLPPSLSCEFGNVTYTLKATVHRAGALTSNLTASQEVTLISTPGEEDTEEAESIVVERFWETQCKYHVAISGKVRFLLSLPPSFR